MIRRIWAIVSDADFYAFRNKAKSDDVSMGEALATLACNYGRGRIDMMTLKRPEKVHAADTGVNYAKERRLSEVDKTLTGGKP